MKNEILKESKRLIKDTLYEMKDEYKKANNDYKNGNLTNNWFESKYWIEALEFSLFVINDTERRYTEQGKL